MSHLHKMHLESFDLIAHAMSPLRHIDQSLPPTLVPLCLCEPILAAQLRFFDLGAGVLRRYEGTTGKWTKIGVPATLTNKPGPVWQGDVIRSFGCCVQHKEIGW